MNPNARAQLEAVRDEWLAPLVAQITAQAERIGRLEAERDVAEAARLAAERERDELRERLDAALTTPGATEAPTVLIVEADGHTHPPPLWRRLLGKLRGG